MIIKLLLLQVALTNVYSQEWVLVWQDEFDGADIDESKWQWEITAWGGGNNEFQVYTPADENSWVQNGKLYIRPTLLEENINPKTGEPFGPDFLNNGVLDLNYLYDGQCTNNESSGCIRTGANDDITPVASARLRTTGRFAFTYGKVEIRAKMPVGDWLWPAMWLLPEQWCYGGWPASGEMDITESIGNENLRWYEHDGPVGIQKMGSVLHWGVDPNQNRPTGELHVNEENHYGNMHDYTMEWTPNGFSFLIDGYNLLNVPDPLIDQNLEWDGFFEFGKPWYDDNYNPWATYNERLMAPFDTQFHLLLNVAVGGTNGFIPDSDHTYNRDGSPAYEKPWRNYIGQVEAMNQFYDARGQDESSGWLWTWEKERNAGNNDCMQVEYVRVYQHSGLPDHNNCPAK